MRRLALVLLLLLLVDVRGARADEPKEIPPTGHVIADTAVAIVNALNRQMKQIEDEGNLALKASEYYRQLMEMEQKLQQERRRITQLDKQLATQEGDLLANLRTQKAGKSDAEVEALEAEYQRRKQELAQARRRVNGMPQLLADVGRHIRDQAKLLKRVKKLDDWVDPKTGQGRLRKAFHKRRYIIGDLTTKLGAATTEVGAVLDKGSSLDVKVERAGAFAGTVDGLGGGTPAFEWIVNGKKAVKGTAITIGDDRVVRVQVKLVDERRKQSRTIKDGKYARKQVAAVDYDFEYGLNDRTFSHWTIEEEEYSDWRVDARTARVPSHKVSTSGAYAKVKGDVIAVTFSPDTASERLRISVIGRVRWEMDGRRGGKPISDGEDASGNSWIEIAISPGR